MNNYAHHFKKLKDQNKKQKQKKMSLGYHSNKVKKESPLLQAMGLLALIGFCLALYGFLYPENIEMMSKVKLSFLSQSIAAEEVKSAVGKDPQQEKKSSDAETNPSVKDVTKNHNVENNVSHIDQLLEKERELVEREKKIIELEEKLQLTQIEMDKKLTQLDQMRREIASKLETRVVQDQESIDKLVGVYSNMKPQSAAMVISRLDEELAISVLKKMKKQDAGNILNFMDAQKAKMLSEKYSGY